MKILVKRNDGEGHGQFCDPHWNLMRETCDSPITATLLLMQMLVNDDEFMRRCGYDPETGAEADVDQINANMAEIGPVCCYLGDETVENIIGEVNVVERGG